MAIPVTLQTVEDDLTGILGGTSLSKVQNLAQVKARAGREVIAKIDPPTTKRAYRVTVYQDVFDYAGPTDNDIKKIIDIKPQVNRNESDSPSTRPSREFDLKKADETLTLEWDGGTQYLRYAKNLSGKSITLDNMNALGSSPNAWTAGGDAQNVALDEDDYVEGSGSIVFDVDGAGTTAYIEKTLATALDLTDHDEKSSIFLWFYIPDSTALTEVTLRFGNSDSVYWSRTITAPHFGSFVNGWNLLRFDWNGATETGTVDPAAIDYLRVALTYDGDADTDFRVDDIVSKLGVIHEINYYSKFIFRSSAGQWADTTTSTSDILNLDVDAYQIYLNELTLLVAGQIAGEDGASMKHDAKAALYGDPNYPDRKGLYEQWETDHPSDELPKQGTYYEI